MRTENILVIGANGQIGSALTGYLSNIYGADHIIASDLRPKENHDGVFEVLDVTDAKRLDELVKKHHVTQIYHLAAILSARGEADPLNTWQLNTQTYFNVLEVARANGIKKIFFPSSIAVFGDHVDRNLAPQHAVLYPTTVYGISKAASENWSNYYYKRYGMDIRSVRYPGIISYQSLPGGGTTDYAVDIFHKAVKGETFTCFLSEDTYLPMIYMDDALRGTVELMEAPADNLSIRTSYNLSGISFSPSELTASIRKWHPDFEIIYQPDFRQSIADSWPKAIDGSTAKQDWGWQPRFDIDAMTKEMLEKLGEKYRRSILEI
ncbi:NAD-dependent epimerase/dehydratase family protein [Olivibacter sitiensis]|uniref:NAD-dependent epimerase/dehydratase family protein n=1 Tax=Olivibacter sitiensis TaxID=376470 RepID=UPI00048029DB|nr:NAD-dependent epimerase/dehydratase family protein [Olivibacter sitiensis]